MNKKNQQKTLHWYFLQKYLEKKSTFNQVTVFLTFLFINYNNVTTVNCFAPSKL